jgi:hypothetical protein
MNENKIRELLKDPADKYYVSAFKKIDDGKRTWNWAAFSGSFCWLTYRKMYFFALFCFLSTFSPCCLFLGKDEALLFSFVASGIFLGAFGNNIYYGVIKRRIKSGWHLNEKYRGTSPVLLYLSVTLFGAIAALVIWIRDKISLKKILETKSSFNTDPSEENIMTVVSSKAEEHYLNKFRKIESGKALSLNWAACFGESFWFISKKMYSYGFVLLAASLAYYVFILGDDILAICGENKAAAFSTVSSGTFWLKALALRATFLFGANRLYYGAVDRAI